jgi:hypothetical protein
VSDHNIEQAFIEILSQPAALDCGGCAPLAITTIYSIVDRLERDGWACPYACASAKSGLIRLNRTAGSAPPAGSFRTRPSNVMS